MTAQEPLDPRPCPICAENAAADAGQDPWFIARLSAGYVRLAPTQYFPGSTFFVAKQCVREIYLLDRETQQQHLAEMAGVAEAVSTAFQPRKMNYEALGNGVPHLHWWLTPRYSDDRHPHGPIWENLDFLRLLWTRGMRPEEHERDARKEKILRALHDLGLTVELGFGPAGDEAQQ